VVQKSAEGILGDICRTKARTLEVTSRCSDIAATMRLNSGQSASGWRERVKPGLALIRGVEADATMADIQTTASIEQLLPLNPATVVWEGGAARFPPIPILRAENPGAQGRVLRLASRGASRKALLSNAWCLALGRCPPRGGMQKAHGRIERLVILGIRRDIGLRCG
jgi:hypothetical protein